MDAIILMAGSGTRTGLDINKALYKINGIPLFKYSINNLKDYCNRIILVIREIDREEVLKYIDSSITLVLGGLSRNESVKNALEYTSSDYILIHDACRIFSPKYALDELLKTYKSYDASMLASKEVNTVYNIESNIKPLDRNYIVCAETPQIVKKELYIKALEYVKNPTDDVSVILNYKNDAKIGLIYTNGENFKITNKKDLFLARMVLENV